MVGQTLIFVTGIIVELVYGCRYIAAILSYVYWVVVRSIIITTVNLKVSNSRGIKGNSNGLIFLYIGLVIVGERRGVSDEYQGVRRPTEDGRRYR